MKKQMELGGIVKTSLVPGYVGFASPRYAGLCAAAKTPPDEEDHRIIRALIADRQPISRKEAVAASPLSEERTVEVISALFHDSVICMDQRSRYCTVVRPDISQYDAVKEILRMHFLDFGIFAAEQLSFFTGMRMGVLRKCLAEFEKEGFLVKGFFRQDDPTVCWMLSEDVGGRPEPVEGMLLLNTQDNLHIYLRDMIKREFGTENVVFKGTRMIGAFKGKVTAAGAKVDDFKGTDEAHRFIRETAASLGVRIAEGDGNDDDWDVSEFYLKTNPGAL
jgi:ATP-dependent Lhr-like helicase